jgi:hypothetical protein
LRLYRRGDPGVYGICFEFGQKKDLEILVYSDEVGAFGRPISRTFTSLPFSFPFDREPDSPPKYEITCSDHDYMIVESCADVVLEARFPVTAVKSMNRSSDVSTLNTALQ